jgi:hypothetical protein
LQVESFRLELRSCLGRSADAASSTKFRGPTHMQDKVSKDLAILVEGSLENLIAQGVEGPMRIPYAKGDDAGGK